MEDLFGYEPKKENKKSPKSRGPKYSKIFEKWWAHWIDLKRNLMKSSAWKRWRELGCEQDETKARMMLHAIEQQLRYWKLVPVRYRPYPASWLRDGRWEDNPEDILGRPLKKWEK